MIPKIVHYCFGLAPDFGGKPWSLIHYVCLKSAVERLKPSKVYFWCEYVPKGPWWRLTENMVNVRQIKAPHEVFGRPLVHPAHRADVVRLDKLLENGGIYLDADVMVHCDFDDLLNHRVVMGETSWRGGPKGLSNAVMLAEPEAPFLRRWREEYRSFRSRGRDRFWAEHSVFLPMRLAKEFPEELTVLPQSAFHWPGCNDERVFDSVEPIPSVGRYATHLCETGAWQRYLEDLTPRRVRSRDSNFHFWARPLISSLPDKYGAPSVLRRAMKCARAAVASAPRPRQIARLVLFPGSSLARLYRRRTFNTVYEGRVWGSVEGQRYFSGVGSIGEPAKVYVEAMVPIIRELAGVFGEETTVVDLGCGDFRVGAALLAKLPPIRYIGCDIVRGLVAENMRRYSTSRIIFRCLDIVADDLPRGHVYLVRQVLQYLPNRDILRVLTKLRDCQNVYVTEGQPELREGPVNPDKRIGVGVRFDWKSGRGRGVELDQPPYNFCLEKICQASPDTGRGREVIITYRLRTQV